jgi:hypothetical protein
MARDPRLQWQQLRAPDTSAASEAMYRAGKSLDGGFTAARDIISKYGEGVVEKNDNALLADIAKLGDEQEFDAWLDKGGLSGRNISSTLRENILGMRTGFVNQEQTRAVTDNTRATAANTRARTGISLAKEGRTASEWNDLMAKRAFERANAGLGAEAQGWAEQYGDTVGGITEFTPDDLKVRRREAIASIESAGSGGYKAVGATHPKYGRALGRYQIMEANLPLWSKAALGREVTPEEFLENDKIQDAIFDHQFGKYVEQHGEENAARAWFGGEKGINNVNASDVHGRVSIGDYGKLYVDALGKQGTTTTRQTPTQKYRQTLIDSGMYSHAEIEKMMASITQAGDERSEEMKAHEDDEIAKVLKEQMTTANQEVLNNPEILTQQQMIDAIVNDNNFTASENEQRLAQVSQMVEQNPGRLAPEVAEDVRLNDLVANSIQAADDRLHSTDQNRAIGDIEKFIDDPAKALEEELGLDKDGEAAGFFGGLWGGGHGGGYDRNDLRNMINEYAVQNNIEPHEAAVAMRDAFERDPWGGNTLGRRFDSNAVSEKAKQLDQHSQQLYREKKSSNRQMADQLRSLKQQAIRLRQSILKANSPQQKAALEANLMAIEGQMADVEIQRMNADNGPLARSQGR